MSDSHDDTGQGAVSAADEGRAALRDARAETVRNAWTTLGWTVLAAVLLAALAAESGAWRQGVFWFGLFGGTALPDGVRAARELVLIGLGRVTFWAERCDGFLVRGCGRPDCPDPDCGKEES
ncbi:hypothetical protein ACFXPA_44105 [Amycolatopsis sp. NPDC059090]|uniref:hypothetical protein n=1 Tax=unclassified Amycolatopsis TaxID=2618356 RepID=UPI003672E147